MTGPRLDDRWDRFWFAGTPLARLGAFRALICALAAYDVYIYRRVVFGDAAAVSAGEGIRPWTPIYLFDVLGVTPIPTEVAQWVYAATLVALAAGCIGLCSRTSCLLGAALFLYWSGLAYSFGKPHHDKVALAFAMIALPFAPIGARLSLDATIGRVRRAYRGADIADSPGASPYACWPLRLAQVSVALGYGFAGWSKLYKGGLEWFNGYTLQGIMMGHDNEWSLFFSQSVLACQVQSLGLVLTQATFPIVLIWPRLLWYFIPAATAFHLITWKTMDTGPYMRLWFVMVAFLPLERVPSILRAWLRTGSWRALGAAVLIVAPAAVVLLVLHAMRVPVSVQLLAFVPAAVAFALFCLEGARIDLIYDGSCRLCRCTIALLLALDWGRRVRALDVSDWERVAAVHPGLDQVACIRDMHTVDSRGRVATGYEAYRALAWRVPLAIPLAPLMYLPPVAAVGRWVYRRVADRRACAVAGRW